MIVTAPLGRLEKLCTFIKFWQQQMLFAVNRQETAIRVHSMSHFCFDSIGTRLKELRPFVDVYFETPPIDTVQFR